MRSLFFAALCTISVAVSTYGAASTEPVTDLARSGQTLIEHPIEEFRDVDTLSIEEMSAKEQSRAFEKLQSLPKLTNLTFNNCDLSGINDKSLVPPKVKKILISSGKLSQGTIAWLSKFPTGVEITFASVDVQDLKFNLGEVERVTFVNCKLPLSSIKEMITKFNEVRFRAVEVLEH